MSRRANIQLRQQELHVEADLGRIIGLLDILPIQSANLLEDNRKQIIQQVCVKMKEILGCSVQDLAHLFILTNHWCQKVFENLNTVLSRNHYLWAGATSNGMRAAKVLDVLIREWDKISPWLTFSKDDLLAMARDEGLRHTVDRFLMLFARPVSELRRLQNESPFQHGVNEWRISALERFPVAQLDDDSYVVPNIRTFLCSFSRVIDYTLLNTLKDDYNQLRGATFELYLYQLATSRFSNATLIPEREYRLGRNQMRGPDLVIIEPGEALLAIEVKARRVSAVTHSTVDEEADDRNFNDVYDAIYRLKGKIEDLAKGLPEYADVQTSINTALRNPPLCICVLPETIYYLTEQIRYRATHDVNHKLHDFPYPYCVMSSETFEYAVEVARERSESLSSVCRKFWEQAGESELDKLSAEHFDGCKVDSSSFFGVTFIRNLVPEKR